MRTTTELTARFNTVSNHTGTLELNAFLEGDFETGSIEYWEAFEREEAIRSRNEDGLLDALDFNTVPFESVEDALSVELYEQDCAEDRAWSFNTSDEWSDEGFEETYAERRARKLKALERRKKLGEALHTAMSLRPDLNWSRYIRAHNTGQLCL